MGVLRLLVVALVISTTCSANLNGDLDIVGLFSIHEPESGTCSNRVEIKSVMAMEAVKWYLRNLNEKGGLPLNIGFQAHETCRDGAIASEIAIDIMNRALKDKDIIGILGPQFSSEAEVISPILSSVSEDNMIAQVGFSTTAARLLEQPEEYPNFVRVVPNDKIQIETMIQTMLSLRWNRIAVVYEDDVYGRDGVDILKSRAESENICVSYVNGIDVRGGININDINGILDDITIGKETQPAVGGVVLIGATPTVRAILNAMQGLSISPLPILMLSEGIDLNSNVFKPHGVVMSKAKGTLLLSPPYSEIVEFTRHWTSIFTDATKYTSEIQSNPWLKDVYQEMNCLNECPYEALPENQVTSFFAEQPLYVHYAVRGAHALVKSIVNLQKTYCPLQNGLCSNFMNTFRTGDVVKQLKGINIDFNTDFAWRLNDPLPAFSIDESGEVTHATDSASYELYNFRSVVDHGSEFHIQKVGEYTKGNFSIQLEEIRDYSTQGAELTWPDVRIPQCMVGIKCVDCLSMEDLQQRTMFIPGDIYVVGLVPVFNTDGKFGCNSIRTISGYQTAESIKFAVENANTKEDDFDGYFSTLKIGVIVMNTCNNPVVVQKKLFDLYENGMTMPDNTTVQVRDKILGFIGALGSTVSIASAETLSRLKFSQISYASTNPTLSDRLKYPYFMRVVTPDNVQARAMVAILVKLGINYIQIIHSVGAYGEGGRDKIREYAALNDICIAQEIAVDEKNSEHAIYDLLLEHSHARLVIVFLRSHVVAQVMPVLAKQIEERGKRGEFLFIGSESWANKQQILDGDTNLSMLGSFTMSVEMYQDKQLRAHIQKLRPQPYSLNPWVAEYLQAKRNCYFDTSYDKKSYPEMCSDNNDYSSNPDFTLDSWDTPAYVAAKSLLMGANAHFKRKCGAASNDLCAEYRNTPEGLIEEILKSKLDLDGSGNKIKVFDDSSDGNVGYRIYNVQRDPDDPQKLTYFPIGRFPLSGTFTFEIDKVQTPTDEAFVSTCPNEKVCAKCIKRTQEPESEDKLSESGPNIELIVLGVLFAVSVIIIIILVLLLVRYMRFHAVDKTIYLTPTASSSDPPSYFVEKMDEIADIPPCQPHEESIQTTDT
ncbi:hypothetical protein ACF0H5_017163 [Mactra antiquata]